MRVYRFDPVRIIMENRLISIYKQSIMKLLLFLLLFSSCASRKSFEERIVRTDSLQTDSRLAVRTMRLPESSATLRIPVGELKSLPPGAVFMSKSGQAKATVRSVHDTLYITATCDSLQQLVYEYQEQIGRISFSGQSLQEKSKQEAGFSRLFLLGCCGLFLFILCVKRKN